MSTAPERTSGRTVNPRGSGDALRHELVSAARRILVDASDASPLSLRAVARAAGVSPTAVYLHFDSAGELVEAVIDELNDSLAEALGMGVDYDSIELSEAAIRYLQWGLEHRGGYQLLFESADRIGHRIGPDTAGWRMIEHLAEELVRRYGVSADDAGVTAVRVWTALHGLVSLRIHKAGLEWATTAEDEARAILAAFVPGATH